MKPKHVKYILENRDMKSINNIAKDLGLSEGEITEFLNKKDEKVKQTGLNLKIFILWISVIVWIVVWYKYTYIDVKRMLPYYKIAMKSSLKQIRALHVSYDARSKDYYPILSYCDTLLPKGEKLRLVLPEEPYDRYAFFRDKGRYFLYPRNFGNNTMETNFVLVYGVKNFNIPKGYKKYKIFAEDKYLLANTKLFIKQHLQRHE